MRKTVHGAAPAASANGRSMEAYKHAIRKNFAFLKQTTRLDDLFAKSIPVAQQMGYLVPVCELHATDTELMAKLARWRDENAFAYTTRFPVTIASTVAWLRRNLLDAEDRILFLVLDRHGTPIGHVGLANGLNDAGDIELENVTRGAKDAQRGIMGRAVEALLAWTEEAIAPRAIYLSALNDNHHAIRFYHKLGFQDDKSIPLRRHVEGDREWYGPVTPEDLAAPDLHFLRMLYKPSRTVDGSEAILIAGPSISAREVSYALDATRHGWNHQRNGYIQRLESAFCDFLDIKHALATSSCTGALHLALAALGIGPGDEVIVPDLSWVATAHAVTYVGAQPVFADVEPDSCCLDPASFEAAITERTRAVMPVHLYGHPARMGKIMEIARRHGLYVVEDAAPAIGAEFRGQKVGTFGDFAAFSLQEGKLVVAGEGGMLVTNSDELHAKVSALADHGRVPGTSWIEQVGLKYRMSNIQAAIGLGQLERVDQLIEAKRRIFSWYKEELDGVRHVTLNDELPWARSVYWRSSILLDERAQVTRDELREGLRRRNVDIRPGFPAISQYPGWQRRQEPQPVALRVGGQTINLPSGVCLKREQVAYVCGCIKDILMNGWSAA